MKRSQINQNIKESIAVLKKHNFQLPPFAYWTPEDWKSKGPEYDEIRDNNLGWDITDYTNNNFEKEGLLLFTIRNGNQKLDKYSKTYAEKIMIVKENQETPYHFHWNKIEDIINRGGGNLMISLFNSTPNEEFADTPVTIHSDGREYEVPAGTTIRLMPGESITLHTAQYHSFWGEEGRGTVLVGEVSECNDDANDNRFYKNIGRFPTIEEDEEPLYYLCNEYPTAKEN